METNARKRKHRSRNPDARSKGGPNPHNEDFHRQFEGPGTSTGVAAESSRALKCTAFEANLVHGANAQALARSLELDSSGKPFPNTALIQWGLQDEYGRDKDQDDPPGPGATGQIWVDRYDARLLLDSLPDLTKKTTVRQCSPTGWTDVSSDEEDMFFFTEEEIEDFRRDKRRKMIEKAREDRMKALEDEDFGDTDGPPGKSGGWGGSDEEPDEEQKELMQRTANHLLASPNPTQLEMRILANHGTDKRFDFLRGRWARAWNLLKAKERQRKQNIADASSVKPLGTLAGYGSDDASEGSS